MLWVRLPPEPLGTLGPRRAARSARHPVTVEIVGSNPIGDAQQHGTVRKPAKRRSSNLRDRLWVRLPPVLLTTCVGWALAGPAGCKPVVRMDLGGSTPSRRTSTTENTVTWCNLAARWIVYPLVRVQIPSSSLRRNDSWRGAMMVLQRGFQSRQRGFDSRPRRWK